MAVNDGGEDISHLEEGLIQISGMLEQISRLGKRQCILEKSRNKPLSNNNASSVGVDARSTEVVSPFSPHVEGGSRSSLQKLRAKLRGKRDLFSARLLKQLTANTFFCFPRLPPELQRAILHAYVISSNLILTTNHTTMALI